MISEEDMDVLFVCVKDEFSELYLFVYFIGFVLCIVMDGCFIDIIVDDWNIVFNVSVYILVVVVCCVELLMFDGGFIISLIYYVL